MTITLELSPEEAAILERDADKFGVAPEERVRSFVLQGLSQEASRSRYPQLRDLFEQWRQNDGASEEEKARDEASWNAARASVRENPLEF